MFKLHAFKQVRALAQQFLVPFGGRPELAVDEPFFGFDELLFYKLAAPVGQADMLLVKCLQCLVRNTVEDAIFQQFDVFVARLLVYIAMVRKNDIGFLAKPKGNLLAFAMAIGTGNAFGNKIEVVFYFCGANDQLVFGVGYAL